MKTIKYELTDGIATLTFDEEGSPVNTMCAQWQKDLTEATAQVVKDKDAIRGIVLASNKSTFFAGADLKATMRLKASDAAAVFQEIEQTKKNFRTLETLGKPVVSCLNGTALGGGWEVALVGHYRIAVDDKKIQFGLPEITLGLIPGASGITKMTRLLGLMGAQPYILESKLFNPHEALELGLVQELVPNAAALRPAALAWIATHDGAAAPAHHPWDDKNYRMPGGTPANPKIAGMLAVAPAVLKQKTRGLYPAPEYALAAMVEGAQVDFDTALRIESRYLARLIVSPVAKNMINTFFFNMNAIKSGRSRPKDVPRYKPQKVGLLGAGMMGAGIAYAQASRGISTVLRDVSQDKADAGKAYSAKLTQARVDKGRMSVPDQAALLARISATDKVADLAGCDLIIEAVFERRDLKAKVTQEAEPLLAPGGFFASNTSTLPISGLATASSHPDKFIGIHFFSPVDKMKLVEIIRGKQTDDDTVARAFDYVQALGKIPIVVNDSRGFYTSRTFGTFVMEGAAMLGEGIPAAAIENAGIQCGMPVGPLAVLDETALSLSVHVLDQTRADYVAEGKTYIATPGELIVERMVKEFDRNGRAAGAGFYDYPEEKGAKKTLWPELKPLFEKPDAAWAITDLKDRLLYRQAVETARCLSENVLTSVHDANIGSIFGIGFPAWTGGAMQFIYSMGVDAFVQRAGELAAQYGPGFALSDEVKATIRKHQPVY
ncbi:MULTISPECIES: 3-hydroxyacyl-CoA dehydrogenase NAD-binding domain-containing protein [unclassified Polaromonas]|jgi:3-hydroxyacyl-CoA dehydrogenase/enoyl-CoA hydratase/3-hydroxybutyryl-CoA epimerase|uniref:3-hydroxyacyl-CoA dehydrogenase NAD-binding domain-containing protein n=1 Tax=unclassified Polaromonas TaxID=2638319 RepID=UPI000BCA6147|nr:MULTISPECIES: 3-hydroxyacyl-CoA dehydrogenase NAD-binding domain-containing protein [unclassified Polaromonas]OYY39177.1 MAG: 3-hydroxyacyl-CoA dehydrogenase [Polaromonas sp. 35-63-35]OYZ22043.1 MAG: 3-hydroxyacyl-CoA dehydrogenase [Polaromonas sp. 16-63-31]OYZ80480.1 MAG: 3-hydroxyacyl-CoA dehydrogenase [Polaromonas sp. 24-63-21]OZA51543.1 MAG: 3-hydroxyacyl-CoA dehydrogenase [Polaromonas sp. 17-63-33]OZA89986.1 MAG: 3-hydroxyacyl-CoA dehydrogenase [Polaromonas sp. 39-63-25]